MNTRKQKLEASLEGLFSPSKPHAITTGEMETQTPVKPVPSQDVPDTAAASTGKPKGTFSQKPTEPLNTMVEGPETASNLPTPVLSSSSPAVISEGAAPVTIGVKQAISLVDTKTSVLKDTTTEDNAKTPILSTTIDEGVQIVSFLLNNNNYGVEISTVQTIIKPQAICPVPFTPSYVEGLTNLRGQIVPVIDLRPRLGFPTEEIGKDTRIIIISIRNEWAGIRVDSVTGVATLPKDTIEPPAGIVSSTETSLLSGIARTEKNIILILDTDALFASMDRSGRRSSGGTTHLGED